MGDSRYVYGPVPSRRLGRSLGVDLVPFKTCTYDCIYCQLGRTTNKTTRLEEYVPVDGVLAELEEALKNQPRPDYIGLAGSGEPTLHAGLARIISGIKAVTDVPVAVLTNGGLLWKPEVRDALAGADLVMPSLDAGTSPGFERVNRPHADISFESMVEGLVRFSRAFTGKVWLEVFVLGGITDGREEMEKTEDIAGRMRLDRVQLNTVARPPAEASALAVTAEKLETLKGMFSCPCDIIAEYGRENGGVRHSGGNTEDRIAALLNRRPCTVEGISSGLNMRPNEVLKVLDALCSRGIVRSVRKGEAVFYEGARGR